MDVNILTVLNLMVKEKPCNSYVLFDLQYYCIV